MISGFKKISNLHNNVFFDIAFAYRYLENINYHSELRELLESLPKFINDKFETLELFWLLWKKNTFSAKKWKEIVKLYKITDKDIDNYNKYLENWSCYLGNNISITSTEMYIYHTANCAAETLGTLYGDQISKKDMEELFDIIRGKLKQK